MLSVFFEAFIQVALETFASVFGISKLETKLFNKEDKLYVTLLEALLLAIIFSFIVFLVLIIIVVIYKK